MHQFNFNNPQPEQDASLSVKHISHLENQIQTMLDGVMSDEVDNSSTSLHFSEDEDYNKIDLPPSQVVAPVIKRTNKKCSTISPNQYYNPYQNKMIVSNNSITPQDFLKPSYIGNSNAHQHQHHHHQYAYQLQQQQQQQQQEQTLNVNMYSQINNIYLHRNVNDKCSTPGRTPFMNANNNNNSIHQGNGGIHTFTGYSNTGNGIFVLPNHNLNNPNTLTPHHQAQGQLFYQQNSPQAIQGLHAASQSINNFKRNDIRKKTYEVNNNNNVQLMQMQNNYFNFQNNLVKNNIINTVNLNPMVPQQQQLTLPQQSPQIQLQQQQQPKQQTINIRNRKEKRFNTITLQQGVNMQVELLLYEINNELIKNEKIDFFIYNKLKNNFTNVIKTHKGSRIFQNYLKKTPSDIIQLIYQEIKPSLIDIMCDFYGNYFIKKFFGCLNKKERLDFISVIKPCFSKLCFDSVGTFPIQGIIEQLNCPYEKHLIISLIQPNINAFAFNAYGSHVVEKITMCFESEYNHFIYEYGIDNFELLAMDQSGICVIKNILLCKDNPKYFLALKKLVLEHLTTLVNHQYGNQVIQAAVQTWSMDDITEIVNLLQNNFALFSMGKYSSNVVEKCIEKNEEILNMFINEICTKDQIGQIMKNSFGNYVIQKALKIAKGNNELLLAEFVNRNIYKLNDKKLITKWKGIVAPHLGTNGIVDNELIQCIEEVERDDRERDEEEEEEEENDRF